MRVGGYYYYLYTLNTTKPAIPLLILKGKASGSSVAFSYLGETSSQIVRKVEIIKIHGSVLHVWPRKTGVHKWSEPYIDRNNKVVIFMHM